MFLICMCSPLTCSFDVNFLCFSFSLYVGPISVYIDNEEANVNDPSHVVHYNRNMIHSYTMYRTQHHKMCNQVAVIQESDDGIVVGQ